MLFQGLELFTAFHRHAAVAVVLTKVKGDPRPILTLCELAAGVLLTCTPFDRAYATSMLSMLPRLG